MQSVLARNQGTPIVNTLRVIRGKKDAALKRLRWGNLQIKCVSRLRGSVIQSRGVGFGEIAARLSQVNLPQHKPGVSISPPVHAASHEQVSRDVYRRTGVWQSFCVFARRSQVTPNS